MAKMKRWVAVFDTHGDQIDREAEHDFFRFVDDFKPQIRIHGGDAFDLRNLRRGVSESERVDSMHADIEAGLGFLKRYKPDVWLLGNHDDRIPQCIRDGSDGNLRQLCTLLWDQIEDQTPNVEKLPYDSLKGVYRLGDLSIMHGFQCGQFVAKQAAEHAASSALMGHVHYSSQIPLTNAGRHVGYTSGCLARLDMHYASRWRARLRWNHGWAWGYTDGEHTSVFLAVKRNGFWNTIGGK